MALERYTIEIRPDPASVARSAAERVVERCKAALETKPTFTFCLAGGSTPKATYELLASDEYRDQIDWSRVEIFFGDERCVPPDSKLSNYAMAKAALLDRVPIRPENVHRMQGEIDPHAAAEAYSKLLQERLGGAGLDLVFLGMGEDGHTLSLFPGTAALDAGEAICVANHVERSKHPHIPEGTDWRLTLTASFTNRSEHVAALITGVGKAPAIKKLLEEAPDPRQIPIRLIDPGAGRFTLLMDPLAAGMDAEDE